MLKKNRAFILILILSMTLSAFGCKTATRNIGRAQSENLQTTQPGVTNNSPQAVTTQSGTGVTIAPPVELNKLFENALKVSSDIRGRRWKSADKSVVSMRLKYTKLAPVLSSNGVPSTTISNISTTLEELGANIKGRKIYNSLVRANDITRYAADAMGSYRTVVPLDFLKLEYYLRDIEISLIAKNWNRPVEDLGFISSIWQSSSVLLNAKNPNIKKMNTTLKTLETSVVGKDTKGTLRQVKKAETIIKDIKKGFSKKK